MKKIPIYIPTLTSKERNLLIEAFDSGWISSLGTFINEFELKFAKYCGSKYAVSTSNGTTALHLVLLALGIKEGDEVIVPDLTFVATSNAIKYLGAKPVYVDIDEENLCISPLSIKNAITKKTKCIIPVHLYGHPCNMPEITNIASSNNLLVVEDAAEAHGAEINGKKVGSFGNASVFSFYGNKIITTGEGGMITTDDYNLYIKLKHLRDHAMSKEKRYWHTDVGFNYRMTNLQAAIGVAQLERIQEIIDKKKLIHDWYFKYLGKSEKFRLNRKSAWAKNVYWLICLEVDKFNIETREVFMDNLKELGIDCRPYFYPISTMPMNLDDIKMETTNVENIFMKGVNLPSYFDLTENDIKHICFCIKKVLLQLKFIDNE